MCIVVVEDDHRIRDLVTQILADEGYSVACFGHPAPVMGLQRTEERPTLFLIDVMLPQMDGIALARRLHGLGFAHVPKIAMSASSQALSQARRSNQFEAFLAKPFDVDELLDCVEPYAAA